MDWPQISVVALGTLAGKWLLDFLKSGWDHFLEGRKQRAAEQRTIRAEQREQDREEAERQRAATEKREHDGAELTRLRVRLCGCTDLVAGAGVVGDIHHFFFRSSLYLNYEPNRAFLIKHPADLPERAAWGLPEDDTTTLAEMKRDSGALRVF